MYRLDVPAGSQIRLSATAGAAPQVRRWDVRMFGADEPAPGSAPRTARRSAAATANSASRFRRKTWTAGWKRTPRAGSTASGKRINRW